MSAKSKTTDSANGSGSPKKVKGGRVPAQGFEITIEAPTDTTPKKEPTPTKQAKSENKGSPKPVQRVPKKKGAQKLSEEEQKMLADWEQFERELVRKRKMEQKQQKQQGRARSSTLSGDQVAQLQGGSTAEQTGDQRTRRALSVSDGLALAAQKSIQRKERSKRASDQLKEFKTELQELRTELQKGEQQQQEAAKKEAAEGATNGDENAGKLRNWRLHMNDMKGKKREDYVSFYKTISKKAVEEKEGEGEQKGEQVGEKADSSEVKEKKSTGPAEVKPLSDSFVHYYLALGGGGKTDSVSGGKSGGKKEGKAVVQAPSGGGSKQRAVVDSRENLVSYYLALRS